MLSRRPVLAFLSPLLRTSAYAIHASYATHAVARSHSYRHITDDDVLYFKKMLGESSVVYDNDEALKTYNTDWMGKYHGKSKVVLKPKTTEQVSEVMVYCSMKKLPVVPQGGNTGLVGGSVPVFDEVVLNLTNMNKVINFDPISGSLVCQAGCILQALDQQVGEAGWMMPLDLGAKGSCTIGGNVATNAGGIRLLRYGSLHGSVLGVEVVMPDGTVMDLLRSLRKDNTGFDLKQLFIGSEGSLGVITAVSIACAPKPKSVQLAFLALRSFHDVQRVLSSARQQLGEILSAVEFLDASSMDVVTSYLPGATHPLPSASGSEFYMMVETHGSVEKHDMEKMEMLLQGLMDEGLVVDGSLAQSSAQMHAMWRVREGITEALVKRGKVFKYDLSMPVADMYTLVEEMREKLSDYKDVKVVGYGHVGDSNLHLNISSPTEQPGLLEAIEPFVYEWTRDHQGSISAEHGIGFMKAEVLPYSKPPEAIEAMAHIKRLFDPHFILNPYKVLPKAVVDNVYGYTH